MLGLSNVGRCTRRQLRKALSASRISSIGESSSFQNSSQRSKSSSASVIDFPIPESIRETVKTSILDNATRDGGRAWQDKSGLNGKDGVNDQISSLYDPLDDLYPIANTRYWPNLPPNVQLDADPFMLARIEVENLSKSIREDLLGSEHPVLTKAASYFFDTTQ